MTTLVIIRLILMKIYNHVRVYACCHAYYHNIFKLIKLNILNLHTTSQQTLAMLAHRSAGRHRSESVLFTRSFFSSVQRPFQYYFSSYETVQSEGGAKKRENPSEKNHLVHPQAEVTWLSLMCSMWGSNPHQR